MKKKKIGAFEAKTHFSQLLTEVAENGAVYQITRRGEPVAILQKDESYDKEKALAALRELSEIRKQINKRHKLTWEEIQSFKNEGVK